MRFGGRSPSWATRVFRALVLPALLLLLSVTNFSFPRSWLSKIIIKKTVLYPYNGMEYENCRVCTAGAWVLPSSGSFQSFVDTCWTGFTSVLAFFLFFFTCTGFWTVCTSVCPPNKAHQSVRKTNTLPNISFIVYYKPYLVFFGLYNGSRRILSLLSHIPRLPIRLMSLLGTKRDVANDCIASV